MSDLRKAQTYRKIRITRKNDLDKSIWCQTVYGTYMTLYFKWSLQK